MTDQRAISPSANAAFVVLASNPAAERTLVCFHYAGGSAQAFYRWRAACGRAYTLVAGELPGRGRRQKEPFIGSIEEAANAFAQSCTRLPQTEVVFYGHSLGALVAFETARALNRMGRPGPRRLIVSCRAAPGSAQSLASLPNLSDAALVQYLQDLKGTPETVLRNEALMRMALPVLRADLKLIYDYRYSPAPELEIPIDVIGTVEDRWAPIEVLLEWRKVTRARFGLRMISGGHFAPVSSPSAVLDILDRDRGWMRTERTRPLALC